MVTKKETLGHELSLEELRKIQLDLLQDLSQFCKENSISFMLAGGTCLGAVRHKGFIPWDDDIDVLMPRPDYERFTREYNGKYSILCWNEDNSCLCTYAKLYDNSTVQYENADFGREIGVNIDVFPIDGLPKTEAKSKSLLRKIMFYRGMSVGAMTKDPRERGAKRCAQILCIKLFYKLFPMQHEMAGKAITLSKRNRYRNADMAGCLVWGYGQKEWMSKKVFEEAIEMPFEHLMLPVSRYYDVYLSHLYGDYMQLPSESERILKHQTKSYFKH